MRERVVAVIPARGGSKRIPRKNIRPFRGVPLLARTIALLRDTAVVDRIVVSTDDAEIAAVARAAGADVPFVRDASLADDHAGTVEVIRDAVERLAREGDEPAVVVAVYPAAVLATADDLRAAIALVAAGGVDYAVPVTSFPFPIQRALRVHDDGSTTLFQPEHQRTRSQDLEPAWHDAGQFYAGTRAAWLAEAPLFSPRTRVVPLPRWRVQDIDTPEDWERAERIAALFAADAATVG
jgi:N-acylneuraminate cytidylyltransferase